MTKCRRLVALDQEVPCPCKSVGDGYPQQRPNWMSHCERAHHDGYAERRAAGMQQTIGGIAVLLHIAREELVVGCEFLGFCFWHQRSPADWKHGTSEMQLTTNIVCLGCSCLPRMIPHDYYCHYRLYFKEQ